ncbi:hypothetical protein BPNPMPFG_005650 [Mesorhizobium sp. AR07]|uniref:hypothetical protein n=1 Tax=Mesorhizobium sp. AR07 TaxID=2865838 RepID=UPI00215F6C48|nr:hypothetical protein [Mesorhizobium sp. AR07]UVK43809.1 hypothetical protein BPNPMPFG_005650 [Mesorhizobium sp. AR07]
MAGFATMMESSLEVAVGFFHIARGYCPQIECSKLRFGCSSAAMTAVKRTDRLDFGIG